MVCLYKDYLKKRQIKVMIKSHHRTNKRAFRIKIKKNRVYIYIDILNINETNGK